MASTTINPSLDGRAIRDSVNETFSNIRANAGNNHDDTSSQNYIPSLDGGSSPNYVFHSRGIFIWDLSSLPAGAIITGLKFEPYINAKLDNHDLSVNITSVSVGNTAALANSDYNLANHGSTRYMDSDIDITSVSTGARLDMTLNSSAISAAQSAFDGSNKFEFSMRFDADIDNGTPTYNTGVSGLQIILLPNASNKPNLTITYSESSAGGSPIFMSSGGLSLT